MSSQRRPETRRSIAWGVLGGALALLGFAAIPEAAARFVFPSVTILLAAVSIFTVVVHLVRPHRVVRRLATSVIAVSMPWYALAGVTELVHSPVRGSSPSIAFVVWSWTVAGLLLTSVVHER